jgi:hypothetical protein
LKNPVYAGFVLKRLFVSRFWDTAVSDPLQILLVVCVGGIEGDEGVVG